MKSLLLTSFLLTGTLHLAACSKDPSPGPAPGAVGQVAPATTNRIDVPDTVRQNLGITFAKVELRPVRTTLRLPGGFELRPEARREYRAMIAGRVNLRANQFDAINPDTLLFTIDSPQWRELQHDAIESTSAIKLAQAALDVAIAQKTETEKSAEFLRQRLANLDEARTRSVQLEAELAQAENQLPRLATEVHARQVDLTEANAHHQSRLRTLASVTGMTVEALLEPVPAGDASAAPASGVARWSTLEQIPILAGITGVVSAIDVTNGGWIETGGLIMTAADPGAIRFRAHALQSDMDRLRDGLDVRIVPPQGGTLSQNESIEAKLSLGFEGSPDERTIPIYAVPTQVVSWSRPGVSAFLEVFTSGSESAELAIPMSAIVRDGLSAVFFRRNPGNPDQVIRMQADLGVSDGRWVVVKSGVKAGDEVVLDGAYQLMLASSGSAQKGGHFHADGTFHEGEDE